VEKATPGYVAKVIEGKGLARAIWQADIEMTEMRIPADNQLAAAHSFKDTAKVLAATRNAVAWGALGHAVGAYDAALTYTKERHQFGKPRVNFQLVQDKLVRMLCDITAMQLYCLRLGRLIEEGHLTDTIAALAKLNNTRKAREVIALARELLGGNGILLENHVIQHMTDIEAVYTYEGTADIQPLIVGRNITGASAFA
jgi:glutaryl-CoA dehydrogenase